MLFKVQPFLRGCLFSKYCYYAKFALRYAAYCVAAVLGFIPAAMHAAIVALRIPLHCAAMVCTIAHGFCTALGACFCAVAMLRALSVVGTGTPYCAASCCTACMYNAWLLACCALAYTACLLAVRCANSAVVKAAMRVARSVVFLSII